MPSTPDLQKPDLQKSMAKKTHLTPQQIEKYRSACIGIIKVTLDQPGDEQKKSVGRPRRWDKNMLARFDADTFARMQAAALKDGETLIDFVDQAVRRDLARRERNDARGKTKTGSQGG